MAWLWKAIATFLLVLIMAGLLLGLTDLDAVQGAAAAFVLATGLAAVVAATQRQQ